MGIQFRILALFSATYVVAKKARTAVKTARMGMVNPNVSHFVTKKKKPRESISYTQTNVRGETFVAIWTQSLDHFSRENCRF